MELPRYYLPYYGILEITEKKVNNTNKKRPYGKRYL